MRSLRGKFVVFGLAIMFLAGFILYNPQKSLALSWEQMGTSGLGGGAGNSTAVRMVNFNNKLYVSIGNYNLPPTGVEIFSSTDGQTWTQVNSDGFGTAANLDAVMTVYNSTLYAGTVVLGGMTQLWKTTNGTDWTQVGQDGFGDFGNSRIVGMSEFNGKLYLGVGNPITGAEVFSLDSAGTLTQVNTDGFDGTNTNDFIWSMQEYNGALYAGTGASAGGAQLWKTTNGTTWSAVMQGGFGDVNNDTITTLFSFNGKLYAGTINATTGTEIWRTTTSDTSWEQANTDGFGDPHTIWSGDQAAIVNGTIYIGTRSSNIDGAKLFTSTNGSTWTMEGTAGFGDPANNFAMYAITFNGRIYLGISSATGAEIWRTGSMSTLSITSTSLDEGTVGSSYSDSVDKNTAGTTPFVWSLVSGSLPDGLTFNFSAGTISGTPTKAGTYTFTVSVTDAGNPTQLASQELSIKINAIAATATATATSVILPETGGNWYLGWVNSLF
ncbi:MAG: putative Ig domain-containing protein [Candidatus Berkelbacteria bacterium]|nr:putative Ig domain-containing protein [Candidatus Berkelbacteria bacterium]